MARTDVDGLTFDVEPGYVVMKYDEWFFYREGPGRIEKIKAVDLLVIADDKSVGYLVEAKDFRKDVDNKPGKLPSIVASKVVHSLGGCLAARTKAAHSRERSFARSFCQADRLVVVFHIEVPDLRMASNKAKLGALNPANIAKELRRLLSGTVERTVVASRASTAGLPWTVS